MQTGSPVAIGAVASQIVAFQKLYESDSAFDLHAPNPNYVGSLLDQGLGFGLVPYMLDPNFRSPRSLEMNIGFEKEIRHRTILSLDFVRNVETHYLIGIDENLTGDVRYFANSAALQAISATNQAFGCGTGTDATSIECAIAAGAQMTDFAQRGLTSSADFDQACGVLFGYPCAFPGVNQEFAADSVLHPGRPLGLQRLADETDRRRASAIPRLACAQRPGIVRIIKIPERRRRLGHESCQCLNG